MNRKAFLVGIDSYPSRPLRVCTHDVQELAATLEMPEYGFEVEMFLDDKVTRKALKKAVETFFKQKADTYVFYFSGRGWATDLGVYLVTVDGEPDEEGFDLGLLRRAVTKLAPEAATVVVILDCCHSGAASVRQLPAAGLSAAGIEARSEDIAAIMRSLPQGRVVIAACRGDQVAYEDSALGHGVFTSSLLEGLLGEAADHGGEITVTGLYDYTCRQLMHFGLQTPVFKGDISGRLLLGQGFVPRTRPQVIEERAVEIER